MLKQRVITALILAALLLGALFLLPASAFVWGMGAVVLLAAWEWANLSGWSAWAGRAVYTAIVAVLMALLAWWVPVANTATLADSVAPIQTVLLVACTWWAVALLWVQGFPSSALLWSSRWVRSLMGLFVLLPTWLALAYVRNQIHGEWLIVMLILVVAAADIGAYFTGRAFGKRKLAPNVSPGKSWEGFWGGVACCALLGLAIGFGYGGGLLVLAIVVPAGLCSVLGDLLESMVKRQRGIKDSGAILPGHGGILDRVDSITAAAPVFALALLFSGWPA